MEQTTFPKGTAQVGDRAWVREPGATDFNPDWRVTAVGLRNEYGNPLDIEITNGAVTRQVSPFLSLWNDREVAVLVIPEVKPPVLEALLHKEGLIAVRDGGGADERYQLFCPYCDELVRIEESLVETSALRYYAPDAPEGEAGFAQGKPGVDESTQELRCRCRTYEGIEFERFN